MCGGGAKKLPKKIGMARKNGLMLQEHVVKTLSALLHALITSLLSVVTIAA